jgi:hypothetical protein
MKNEMIEVNVQMLESLKDIMLTATELLKDVNGIEDAKTMLMRGVFAIENTTIGNKGE